MLRRSLHTFSRTSSDPRTRLRISHASRRRAFEIAERMGARIIRVFSYWRTVDPDACFDRVASALRKLADEAGRRGLIIGIENEHACNIATGEETARLLAAVDHPALQVIWDPANAYVAGEIPFPDGYAHLSVSSIAHVHAKDCHVRDHVPVFGPLGEMGIDWRGQMAALARDGYRGGVSLETHWDGPGRRQVSGQSHLRAKAEGIGPSWTLRRFTTSRYR